MVSEGKACAGHGLSNTEPDQEVYGSGEGETASAVMGAGSLEEARKHSCAAQQRPLGAVVKLVIAGEKYGSKSKSGQERRNQLLRE